MRYLVSLALGLSLLLHTAPPVSGAPPTVSPEVRSRVQRDGSARVLVRLRLPAGALVPEGDLPGPSSVLGQRRDIASVQSQVTTRLRGRAHAVLRRYQTVPVVALEVGPDALRELEASPLEVESVTVDRLHRPLLAESVPLIGADLAWDNGFDGTGFVVAVLDTGVDRTHPFLAGKVVEEACYSSTIRRQAQTVCPNKKDEQVGTGAATPCSLPDCLHGTHVAGIVAGDGVPAGVAFSGVARGAQLMAVQVFSRITSASLCGGSAPCLGAYDSDIIAGLERVYQLRTTRQFAAVNLSLGGGSFTSPCDDDPHKPMIDNLRSVGIATVVAAGNDGSPNALAGPACVSSAVSVGSTDQSDEVSWFSNFAAFLSLLAPGESITSALLGGGYIALDGTSMAAPHVAGAWAILKQAAPGAGVDEILGALTTTGVPVTAFTGVTKPRVQVFRALASLSTTPLIGAITPSKGGQGSIVDVTIEGANFQPGAVVSAGAGVTVTPQSVAEDRIVAQFAIDAAAALGARTVTVVNPDATSASRAGGFTVTLPPPQAVVLFNGKAYDRVGQGETALAPDGANDGTLTAAVTGGARTVRQLELATSAGGRWDTIPGNSYWVLGAASAPTAPLFNTANGSVSFAVANGGSFVVFATDVANSKFTPGTTLTLTITFTDDTVATASAVVPVVPTVTAVSPASAVQGTTAAVTVTGTAFLAGALVTAGSGVTVSGVTVLSSTQLQASFAVAADAPVGAHDVQVTNPGGGHGTLTGGFAVTAPGAPPPPPPPPAGLTLVYNGKVQDRVGPSETALGPDGASDATLTATLGGGGRTVRQLVLTSSTGGRWDTIPANSYWVLGAARDQTGPLLNAANGAVSFAVGNGESFAVFATDVSNGLFVAGTTLTLTATFTDDTTASASAAVPVVPTVTAVAPASGEQGTSTAVTVTGTSFQAGATVSAGAGVTVSGVTVASATQIQATFAVAIDAAVGPRDVQVTNPGGGVGTRVGGFAVTAPGVPPPPPPPPAGLTLVYNGKAQDRVGQGETALAADGTSDATLTATLTGGGRTVRQLVLTSSTGGRWDTIPGNSYWVLGAAADQTTALLNAANGSVSFPLNDGGTFVVFATDVSNGLFVANTTLTLTATFTDDTTASASTVVPVIPTVTAVAPASGVQGASVAVTVTGASFQSGAAVSAGAGVTVSGVSVVSSTQIQATFAVATDAAVGPRDVQVTNPGGGVGARVGAFAVTAPGAPPPPPPPPPGISLAFEGKIRDRVRPAEGAPSPDGANDGTLTATLTGGGRTVRQLVLTSSTGGRWDTIPGNGYWVLGAASTLDSAVLNGSTGAVNFAVADGASFVVFATDWYGAHFNTGTTFTLTVTFTDDTVAAGTTTAGP